MIHVLLAGKLAADPVPRRAWDGGTGATAKVMPDGAGPDGVVSLVSAYGDSARTLLALNAGDPIAVVGRGRPALWTRPDGQTVAGLEVTASEITTPFQVRRKRHTVHEAQGGVAGEPDGAE